MYISQVKDREVKEVPEKVLHFLLWLKTKHRHSIFYDYKPEKLAHETNLSINTIRRYIGILKNANIASITNGHLHLIALHKIKQIYKYDFSRQEYFNLTFEVFRSRLIINFTLKQQHDQEYIITLRSILETERPNLRGISTKAYCNLRSKALKLSKEKDWEVFNENVILSYRQLKGKIGLSVSTVKKYLNKELHRMGYKIKRYTEELYGLRYSDYLNMKRYRDNVLFIGGTVVIDYGFSLVKA